MKDSFFHGFQWLKKKGPKALRSKAKSSTSYRDRKEDKLKTEFLKLLKKINLNPENSDKDHLQASYEELMSTKKIGSEYGLTELKNYLTLLLPYTTNHERKRDIVNLMLGIEQIHEEARRTGQGWQHILLPRSEEVILPTIDEMVEDKVPFLQ